MEHEYYLTISKTSYPSPYSPRHTNKNNVGSPHTNKSQIESSLNKKESPTMDKRNKIKPIIEKTIPPPSTATTPNATPSLLERLRTQRTETNPSPKANVFINLDEYGNVSGRFYNVYFEYAADTHIVMCRDDEDGQPHTYNYSNGSHLIDGEPIDPVHITT